MKSNSINALSGVAYGSRSLVSPLLVVRGLYVAAFVTQSIQPSYWRVPAVAGRYEHCAHSGHISLTLIAIPTD
jgi:hypothetical protein